MSGDGPDKDDFETYRRLILAELQRLNKECEEHSEIMRQHELKDKDNTKQLELAIQALQLKAEQKGREAGEKAGVTYGAGAGSLITAILYGVVYVIQHLPT